MIKVTVTLNGVERTINGDGQHIKGSISQEVGAINSFEFEIFPQNVGYELIQSRKTLVKAINTLTGRVEFAGRVLLAETKMENNGVISKRVTCESYLGYLYDSVQPFREEQTTSLRDFLQIVISNHNVRVEEEKRMQLGTVDVDVAGTGNVTKGLQYETTYDTIKNKLVDIYGGELEVVENEGVLTLNYVKQIGTTRATTIELGRNMQAASREVSPLNIITRVIPLGAKIKKIETDAENNPVEVETGERLTLVGYTPEAGKPALTVPWIDDEEKQEECGIVCGVLELEDVTEQSNLYRKAIEYMQNENLVALSHTLTALDLKEIGQDIDSLNCGDSYPVKNVLIGLDETLRITKKTIDINAPYKSSITIGEKRATLSSIQAGTNATIGELFGTIQTINKTTNTLKEHVSSTEKSVNELTSKVEGIDGTYFYIRYSPYSDGHVMTDAPESDTEYMGTCSTSESTAPTDYTKYTWVRIKGIDGTNGTAGAAGKDGVSQYLHIKYSNNGINFTEPNGETLGDWLGTCVDNNEEDPTEFDDYEWHKIKGEQGLAGKDGIGIDGTSSYFHVRYSEVENPTKAQMTENPSKYIGTYVDNIEDDSDDPTKYKWVQFMGTNGIAGIDGEDGQTYYLHIKYSNDGGASFTGNSGEDSGKYIGVYTDTTKADSTNVNDYKWSLIKGADGITYYTWIKYADDANGTNMSDNPEGKKYIGLAYNKTSATESTTASNYKWSLIQGANGVDGDDGVTYYTWIKYADDANGTNMSDDPTDKKYIGLAYNKTTPTESATKSDYKWALFRGEDGIDGHDGEDGVSTYFYVRYSAYSNGASMSPTPDANTQYMGVCSTTSSTAPTNTGSYTWTKIKGADGTNGTAGAAGKDGKTSYLHIKYSDDGKTFTANNGEDLGAWIGTYVDFNETDSTTFSDYTWKKFTEDVDIGGRNLLLNTKLFEGDNITGVGTISSETYNNFAVRTLNNSNSSSTYQLANFADIYPEKLGEQYTLSFYAKGSGTLRVLFYNGVQCAKAVLSNGTTNTNLDGSSEWTLTNSWARYSVTWTLKDTGDITVAKSVSFRLLGYSTAYVCGAKLEKGNVATDWTPAPEDIEQDVKTSVVTLETHITNNSETIKLMAEKDYVETSTFNGYKQTVEKNIASLEVEAEAIDLKFESKTTEMINDTETKFTEFYKYFTFTENGLEIRSSDSVITLEIDNDMIVFKKNGARFGWWDGENFHTGNIVVEVNERAQFGNFAFVPRSSGSLSFLKVGG